MFYEEIIKFGTISAKKVIAPKNKKSQTTKAFVEERTNIRRKPLMAYNYTILQNP